MTKESTKKVFKKAFSDHMLLNFDPEEEEALRTYGKSEERIRLEQEREEKYQNTSSDEPTPTEDTNTSFEYEAEERYYVSGDHPTPWVKGKEILGPFEGKQRQ
jgi:hypothetical protein